MKGGEAELLTKAVAGDATRQWLTKKVDLMIMFVMI
jgi:hypothetical protein